MAAELAVLKPSRLFDALIGELKICPGNVISLCKYSGAGICVLCTKGIEIKNMMLDFECIPSFMFLGSGG